jgi:hypothetical protein
MLLEALDVSACNLSPATASNALVMAVTSIRISGSQFGSHPEFSLPLILNQTPDLSMKCWLLGCDVQSTHSRLECIS